MNFYNFITGNIEGIYFLRQYLLSLFVKYPCKKLYLLKKFSTKTCKDNKNNYYNNFKTQLGDRYGIKPESPIEKINLS